MKKGDNRNFFGVVQWGITVQSDACTLVAYIDATSITGRRGVYSVPFGVWPDPAQEEKISGVNFINMLAHSFYTCRLQKRKKKDKSSVDQRVELLYLTVFFSVRVKAASKHVDEIDPSFRGCPMAACH